MVPTRLLAVLLVTLAAAPIVQAADGGRAESEVYVAGYMRLCNSQHVGAAVLGPLFDPLHDAIPPYQGPGAGCFSLDGTESTVDMTLDDATGRSVPGYYYFVDAEHESVTGQFCGGAVDVPVPDGAIRLEVYVAPVDLFGTCGATASDGGTVGTVTVDFHA